MDALLQREIDILGLAAGLFLDPQQRNQEVARFRVLVPADGIKGDVDAGRPQRLQHRFQILHQGDEDVVDHMAVLLDELGMTRKAFDYKYSFFFQMAKYHAAHLVPCGAVFHYPFPWLRIRPSFQNSRRIPSSRLSSVMTFVPAAMLCREQNWTTFTMAPPLNS